MSQLGNFITPPQSGESDLIKLRFKMLFIPLAEIDRTSHQTSYEYFKKVPFGFRLLFITSLVFVIFNQALFPHLSMANIPSRTFELFEFWRILTPPLACLEGFIGDLGFLFAFWWLLSLFPYYERKYSTVHLLIQIFFQNFIVQIIYSTVVMIMLQEGWKIETYNDFFFSVGWFPLVIIWIFKYTAECPEEQITFCFLPCLIKNKFIGWIAGLFFILFSTQSLPLVIAMLLGSLQYQLLGRSLIQPPFCLHRILECLIPQCIKNWDSFVEMESVEVNLKIYIGYGQMERSHLEEGEAIQNSNSDMNSEISDFPVAVQKRDTNKEFKLKSSNEEVQERN